MSIPCRHLPAPRSVVGTLHTTEGLQTLHDGPSPRVDFLEIRLDCLPLSLPRRLLDHLPRPLLLTARSHEEGGRRAWTDTRRLAHLQKFLGRAGLVDWEWRSWSTLVPLLDELRKKNIPILASCHDFMGTPPLAELLRTRDRALASGASIFKLATTLRNTRDLQNLLALQEQSHGMAVATMGMGPLGRASRLLCAALGSVLNYGWLDRPEVPGQFPARLLKQRITEVTG